MKCGSDATADSQRKAKPKLTMLIKLGSASHVRELSKHAPPPSSINAALRMTVRAVEELDHCSAVEVYNLSS